MHTALETKPRVGSGLADCAEILINCGSYTGARERLTFLFELVELCRFRMPAASTLH
jgi:hypothetical protein